MSRTTNEYPITSDINYSFVTKAHRPGYKIEQVNTGPTHYVGSSDNISNLQLLIPLITFITQPPETNTND